MIRLRLFSRHLRMVPFVGLLLTSLCIAAPAATKPVQRAAASNEPFTTFRKLDQVLTRIDRSNLDFNSEIKDAEKTVKKQRAQALRALRHSKHMRSLLISS